MERADKTGFLFLSYTTADRERAFGVADALEAAGLPVWIDRRGIAGGEHWAAEIATAIRDCRALAVLCSEASLSSRNVRQEIQLAWDYDRLILPLMLEMVSFPKEIAYFLHGRQWVEIGQNGDPGWIAQVTAALNGGPGEVARAPIAPAAQRATGARLPEPPTPLVGRAAELAEISRLLRDDRTRLLTLTGPGGVGKTRLALSAAQNLADSGGPEAAFVDLAPVSDPKLVPSTIAAAAGLRDPGERPPLEALRDFLGQRPLLLVIDNMEHLLASASIVAGLLRECPGLKLLVTSREPLRVRGEHELPVLPMPLPDANGTLAQLSENDAVALFASRARDVRAGFELTEENGAGIAEICRQLDGLPLAIELAAARTRLLSIPALLKRLEGRLGLLTGGARDAPDRQQTLRDTIAWSYDLLSPEDQAFFVRLSVFVGGFTLDGAEAVAGDDEIDPFEQIFSLQEKSLLQSYATADGEPRFRMLETIREFGLEQLQNEECEEEARQRHFDYYLLLSERLGRVPALHDDPDWYANAVARWDLELDNFRAAWQWRQSIGDPLGVLRLIGSNARFFWIVRPFGSEVVSVIEQNLQAAHYIPADLRAAAELTASTVAAWIGDLERGFAHAEEGLRIARETNNRAAIGNAHVGLGAMWEVSGDCQKSAAAYREAVAVLRDVPGNVLYGIALGELGDRLLICGENIEEAIALIDQALEQDRAMSYSFGLAVALGQRAHAARLQGDLAMARRLFGESVAVAHGLSDERRVLGAFIGLAGIVLDEGEPEHAARIIGATKAAMATRGKARVIAHPLHNERIFAAVKERLGVERYEALLAEGRTIPYEQLLAEALTAVEQPV